MEAGASGARKLADLLNEEECRKLLNEQDLALTATHKGLVEACLPNQVAQEEGGRIMLSSSQTAEIRYLVIKYLNTLETVLAGWRHNISDRAMIDEEFQYLLDSKEGHKMLKLFRQVQGEEAYPAILEFEQHLVESKKPRSGKAPILP
jgi:hypothetical protein